MQGGLVVERPIRIRNVPGSMPGFSKDLILFLNFMTASKFTT